MSVVRQTLRARRDLVETIAHLAERSEDAARRFRVEARTTLLAEEFGISGADDEEDR